MRTNNLLTLYQLWIEHNFPSWVDEIAEPHPDVNIKVAAFTVTQNLIIPTNKMAADVLANIAPPTRQTTKQTRRTPEA